MPPDGHFSRHACQKSYDLYLTEVRSLLNSMIKCCKLLMFFCFLSPAPLRSLSSTFLKRFLFVNIMLRPAQLV